MEVLDKKKGLNVPESSILTKDDLLVLGYLLFFCSIPLLALLALRLLIILVANDTLDKPLQLLFKGFPRINHTIVDVMLYTSSDLALIYAIQHPNQETQSQISIFAVGVAMLAYLNQSIRRREIFTYSRRNNDFYVLKSCIWAWTFLTPMSLCTKSAILHFFVLVSPFGGLGFVVFQNRKK